MDFNSSRPPKPLRLWPGVVAAVLLCVIRYLLPFVLPGAALYVVLGGLACGLAVIVWWLFFSRAPWSERIGAVVLMIVALFGTSRLVHESISNGMMGMLLPMYAIPALGLALAAGAVAGRHLSSGPRRLVMSGAILLACGVFTLLRTGGIVGGTTSEFHWRWTPSPEERLLAKAAGEPALPPVPATAETLEKRPPAQATDEPIGPTPAPTAAEAHDKAPAALPAPPTVVEASAEWPGFRGPGRDSIIRGVRIDTDWTKSPPVQLWRRAIGPGWSSFAVRGNLLYTQEQRGDDEMVSCYNLTTGEPVWRHRDATRFWESNAGAGPRATPTLSNGRVYTFGATGIVNALDARSGAVVWSRNAGSDTGAPLPGWGFASSPLAVDNLVIVAASGRLVAYDVATGKPRWFSRSHGASYSSPHLATIAGVTQVLLLNGAGAISVAPADGKVLWEHAWEGSTMVQPALTANGDILISTTGGTGGVGTRRLAVVHGSTGWTIEERWTSNGLKPYFNDFVVHGGHAFGFDGSILACIDLADGKRTWKGGRYGNGQLVLLADQNLLLVLSEEGELALVSATPDKFTELARLPAIEGKTWNHPALVGDVLLVRNGEEMAAFKLSLPSS